MKRVVPPHFPARDFDVTSFGARPDGSDARPSFVAAMAACTRAGGGRVIVPAGTFTVNGPIHLQSNMNLHVAAGATVKFGTNPRDYLPAVLVRWEGIRCYNYSPLIYAYQQKNIAITGAGTIDGQAPRSGSGWYDMFSKPAGRSREELRSMGRKLVPVSQRIFGGSASLRPPLFHVYECQNILLEGVTVKGSPFWTLAPAFSSNITVRHLTVRGNRPTLMHNDDGFIADSCQDVLVEDCNFDTNCDNVSIKSGRDNDSWSGSPSENIVVRGCTFKAGCGAVSVGSEVGGGVRNLFVENNRVLDVRNAFYVKSNPQRGGVVEKVYVRNHAVTQAEACIHLEATFMDVAEQDHPTLFREFDFDNITCQRATEVGIHSQGLAIKPFEGIGFRNITIDRARAAMVMTNTRAYSFENVTINGVPIGTQSSL